MKNFHLIGQNIQSSLSPLIHNYLFKLKGYIPKQYHYSIYVKQSHRLTLQEIEKSNIFGLSITIPFKQQYSKEIQQGKLKWKFEKSTKSNQNLSAQQILARRGIINTIRRNVCESSLYQSFDCFNTDIFGIKQSFNQNKLFSSLILSTTLRTKAIIIGGGATAQTFMSYFQEMNLGMLVINRTVEKIEHLKKNFYPNIEKIVGFACEDNQNESFSTECQNIIIINTLPTSILQQYFEMSDSTTTALKQLIQKNNYKQVLYMDVNYRDHQNILQNFIKRQIDLKRTNVQKISTGLDMLVWQAIMQNYIFCNEDSKKKNDTDTQSQFEEQLKQLMAMLRQQRKI